MVNVYYKLFNYHTDHVNQLCTGHHHKYSNHLKHKQPEQKQRDNIPLKFEAYFLLTELIYSHYMECVQIHTLCHLKKIKNKL